MRYLAGLRRVDDVHSARLNAVGFGPPVQRKSAFPSTPISIGQGAIVPVRERGGVKDGTGNPRLISGWLENMTRLFL